MKKKINKIFICMSFLIFCFLIVEDVNAAEVAVVKCGGMEYGIPAGIATFSRNIYNLVKIMVPIIIILLGMLDFAKAAMASEIKNMDEYKNKLIRRIIAGVMIFFVLSIVNFVFTNIKTDNSSGIIGCLACFTTTEEACNNASWTPESTKKSCSSFDLNKTSCPATDDFGTACKTVLGSTSVPKCLPACKELSTNDCLNRSDCQMVGSCVDK